MLLFSDRAAVPELELGFAIAADSSESDKTFTLMKDTVTSIIDKYGMGRVRYGLIVFGDSASIKANFRDGFQLEQLKTLIEISVKEPSGAALDKALEEAKKLFTGAGVRGDARKVLVVITDKASGRSPSDIRDAAGELEDEQVHTVGVCIGEEADKGELELIARLSSFCVKDKDLSVEDLSVAIVEAALKGRFALNTDRNCTVDLFISRY